MGIYSACVSEVWCYCAFQHYSSAVRVVFIGVPSKPQQFRNQLAGFLMHFAGMYCPAELTVQPYPQVLHFWFWPDCCFAKADSRVTYFVRIFKRNIFESYNFLPRAHRSQDICKKVAENVKKLKISIFTYLNWWISRLKGRSRLTLEWPMLYEFLRGTYLTPTIFHLGPIDREIFVKE